MRRFPDGFLWGTATSAHQIEGNNTHSDWWRAEQEGRVPHASGQACDSYRRFEEDFDLAKAMHNTAHRFSLEWARVEPEEGKFQEREVEHYRRVISALKARGMEPFVTLHHFTNPQWFAEKGGWANKKAPEYFERYITYVVERLGGEVRYWITMNEPLVVLSHGYVWGSWPPFQRRAFFQFLRASSHMIRAHKGAYDIIHKRIPEGSVGMTHAFSYSKGIAAFLRSILYGFFFMHPIQDSLDFIGINYYRSIGFGKKIPKSDFGWEIYPAGLHHLLKRVMKWNKPVFITENGIADADDDQRSGFIQDHLLWLHRAIEEGADVRGYFHWSLLDNFEWAEGFTKRFGLVAVDFETFKRDPRPSAKVYAEICYTNTIP